MSDAVAFVKRHPLALLLAVGIAIRLLLSPIALPYDIDYWALTLRNMQVGEGLYGVEGYFYTPVWGYVLGLSSLFQSFILDMGETSERVAEALFTEDISGFRLSATVQSVSFNLLVKVPLIICDVLLALSVFYLSKCLLGEEKALKAAALTFLCPLSIGVTSFIGMPDTISALFSVLTVILLIDRRFFLAGMTFAVAVWTKFFPAFLVFCLVSYVIIVSGDRRTAMRGVAMAAVGSVMMTAALFLPQIAEGNLDRCFQFISDRVSVSASGTILDVFESTSRVAVYLAALAGSFLLSIRLFRAGRENCDQKLVKYCFAVVLFCLLYPPAPQYVVLLVPFLAFMAAQDRRYMLPWWMLSISAFVFLTPTNADMLLPIAAWTDLLSVESVMDVFNAFRTSLGPFTVMELHYAIGGIIQYSSLILALLTLLRLIPWKSDEKGQEGGRSPVYVFSRRSGRRTRRPRFRRWTGGRSRDFLRRSRPSRR